jgi:hypothetical protein
MSSLYFLYQDWASKAIASRTHPGFSSSKDELMARTKASRQSKKEPPDQIVEKAIVVVVANEK